jgi:hypothetical protein
MCAKLHLSMKVILRIPIFRHLGSSSPFPIPKTKRSSRCTQHGQTATLLREVSVTSRVGEPFAPPTFERRWIYSLRLTNCVSPDYRYCFTGCAFSLRSERGRGAACASGKAVWTWPPVVAVDAGPMQIQCGKERYRQQSPLQAVNTAGARHLYFLS